MKTIKTYHDLVQGANYEIKGDLLQYVGTEDNEEGLLFVKISGSRFFESPEDGYVRFFSDSLMLTELVKI